MSEKVYPNLTMYSHDEYEALRKENTILKNHLESGTRPVNADELAVYLQLKSDKNILKKQLEEANNLLKYWDKVNGDRHKNSSAENMTFDYLTKYGVLDDK